MNRIEIALGQRSYPVLVGASLLDQAQHWLPLIPPVPLVIFTNERVAPLYLETLRGALTGREVHTFILPDGEAEKSFANYQGALEFLAQKGIRRDACLLALGGGVIGDRSG